MGREGWSSAFAFILASVGAAVGLGNIWRFPYIVGQYGGGAFLIPYFVSIVIFGIPLLLLELSAGRRFKGSVMTVFRKIDQRIRLLALFPLLIMFFIISYYVVITGWTIAYSLIFALGNDISFDAFTSTIYPLFCYIIVILIAGGVIAFGVKKGIERTNKLLIPLLFLFLLALLIKALSLPNALDGLSFYLTPDFSVLSDPSIWLVAISQVVFSLSVGCGIILTYGSYLKGKESHLGCIAKIAVADTIIAIVSGLIVFSIVFSFGFDPASGPTLAFSTMSSIFEGMDFGLFFGWLFFLLLFIAAFTSVIAVFEVLTAVLMDEFGLGRTRAIALVVAAVMVAAAPSAMSYSGIGLEVGGMRFLDFADLLFGTVLAPIAALSVCIGLGWFWDEKDMLRQVNRNSRLKVGRYFVYLVRYVIPAIILALFISRLVL